MAVLGFDVFGTLVDPRGIGEVLRPYAGEQTDALVREWRRTQLEFTFRRAAMDRYIPFDRVTRDALVHAAAVCGVSVPESRRGALVAAWTALPSFPEAADAVQALRDAGHRCLAFSNGTPAGLDALLRHCGLAAVLDDVVSVDEVASYKPAPVVYDLLVERGGGAPGDTWLVSGNGFDIVGARAAGLRAAWVRRDPMLPFDPWDEEPDRVVGDLTELISQSPFRAGAD